MARINWNGSEIEATVVEKLLNGNYRMMAKGHAPRIESGTIVEVAPKDIVSLDIGGAKFPGPGAVSQNSPLAEGAQGFVNNAYPTAQQGSQLNTGLTTTRNPGLVTTGLGPQFQVPVEAAAPVTAIISPPSNEAAIIDTRSGAAPMATPEQHFKGLTGFLREEITAAVADAKGLRARRARSLGDFGLAKARLHGLYDEVDAATAEINSALLGDEGANGTVEDTTKNS